MKALIFVTLLTCVLPITAGATDFEIIPSPFESRNWIPSHIRMSPDGQWYMMHVSPYNTSDPDTTGLWVMDVNFGQLTPVFVESEYYYTHSLGSPTDFYWGSDSQSLIYGTRIEGSGDPPQWVIVKLSNFLPSATAVDETHPRPPSISLTSYPNPFNPAVTLSYSIPSNSHTSLKIFDVSGRLVNVLVDKTQPPADYRVEWNPNNLASGVYFAQLICAEQIRTRKIVLLK